VEEIKQLYQRLNYASDEEREKIWKFIIEKNRVLFDKNREELNKLLKKKINYYPQLSKNS